MPQSVESLEWLEQPPSIEEIDAVLSALRTDAATSTVRIDMFCSDKDFWAPHLTVCIQRFFENDAEDLAHMLLVLIPKGGGDEHAAFAQRPISISHALYRIISKWQEQRLSKALNGCINKHQFGAQRDKSAEEPLIMMRIAMEMAERSRQLGYQTHMLLLDWKKFFDKVEWWSVEATLVHVGVPLRVVRFVETLVATRRCSFVTAHGMSRAFTPQSGLGQGCLLAALLAILSQQPLAFTLDAVCQGIHIGVSEMRGQEGIPGVRTTHMGYVDDMTCTPNPCTMVLSDTREDVKLDDGRVEPLFLVSGGDLFVMGQLIEEWCTVTSSTINASKCALLVWERDRQDPMPWAFKLAGRHLSPVRSAKLLGVRWSTVDQKLQLATLHEAHRRVARLARFKGLPPETVSRILNIGILPVLFQSAIAFTTATATGEIETLQVAIDAAVRAASHVPAMSERMLLPINQGGLGVLDIRQEIAISRVATWLRVINGDTVAATVLQCEMQRVCRFTQCRGDTERTEHDPFGSLRPLKPLANDNLGRASHASRQLLHDLRCLCVTLEWRGDHSCREMHPLRSHIFPERVTRIIQQVRVWMQSENGRSLASIDICSDGGVCHRTRRVTGGFAIVCTDTRGDTCRKAAGWRIGFIMGQATAPPQESSFSELVACQVAQSAVRHLLDGQRVDDTLGDIVIPSNQANSENIPVRAWLDNKSVVDLARQSLCQKSPHQNSTNMGRFRELAADLRHNNTQIEWTKGHTDNTSLEADLNREAEACRTEAYDDEFPVAWPSERRCRRSHTRAVIIGVLKLKQKQQNHSGDSLPTRSHIASPSHCTVSRESRLVPMLLCSGSDGLGCGLVQKAPRSTETVIVLAKQLNNK